MTDVNQSHELFVERLKEVERHLPDVDLSRKLHLPQIWSNMFPLAKRLEANRAKSCVSY